MIEKKKKWKLADFDYPLPENILLNIQQQEETNLN